MNENIYDILSKLNGVMGNDPLDTVEADPIVESIDANADLMQTVRTLEEKYKKSKDSGDSKEKSLRYKSTNTLARDQLRQAWSEFPNSASDDEALAAHLAKKEKEIDKKNAETEQIIKQANDQIQATAKQADAANQRYDNLEKRMQAFTQAVAKQGDKMSTPQQAQAAVAFRKDINQDPSSVINQIMRPAAGTKATTKKSQSQTQEPTDKSTADIETGVEPTVSAPAPTTTSKPAKLKIVDPSYTKPVNTSPLKNQPSPEEVPTIIPKTQPKKYAGAKKLFAVPKTKAAESIELDETLLNEQSPVAANNAEALAQWSGEWAQYHEQLATPPQPGQPQPTPPQQSVKLEFPDGSVNLSKETIDRIITVLTKMKAAQRQQFINTVLGDREQFNWFLQNMNSPRRPTTPTRPTLKKGQTSDMFDQPDLAQQKLPAGARDPYLDPHFESKEFLGNPGMKNLEQLAESLMEKYMGFEKTVAAIKKGGSAEDPEAVAAAIGRKKYGKAKFQKAAAAGKKLGEEAKPDFLDLDKDGDTEEPMKQAAKDAKDAEPAKPDSAAVAKRKRLQALKDKQEDERAEKGDYDSKSASRVVKGRAYGGAAQKDDEDKDLDESGLQAYLGKKKYGKEGMQALQKAGREGASKEKMALIRAKHDKMDEVAPPGAKAERMVKGIKKSLSKDGHLSGKDKAIAYATTWKAHNKGVVESANLTESRNAESSEYTYETIGRVLCDEQPGLDCNSEAFVKAVYDELIEMKLTPKAARWLVHYDEDFIGDCATSYDHFCKSKEKEMAECGAPMNSFVSEEPVVDAVQELDEIARLAGLPTKTCESCDCNPCKCDEGLEAMAPSDSSSPLTHTELDEAITRKDFRMVADLLKNIPDIAKRTELAIHHADIFKQQNPRFKREMFLAAAGVDTTPIEQDEVVVDEAEMGEGNEFSGALAAAKASGAKEFEVDGKKYTVKEDINVNVSATGEEDVVNLIRKLSGMPVVAIQTQPAEEACGACGSSPCGCESLEEDGPKERDVEYTNSPREEVAGTDAAIPSGDDLHRAKKSYSDKPFRGDNPMAVAEAKEESLWKAYESMINDVKA